MAKTQFNSSVMVTSLLLACAGCSMTSKPGAEPSVWNKMGKSISSAGSSVAAAVKPKELPPVNDSEKKSKDKPGCATFVAMAHISEQNNNFEEAEVNYKKALKIDPNHLGALVGYARLEDRRSNFDEAIKLYKRACKKNPKEGSAQNDLGLCYHRHSMLPEAAKALEKAVELNGDNKLYRNNLAAVYVEQGKHKEALSQLCRAHGDAVGNYNMGYLLVQKKDNAGALTHFRKAIDRDPSLNAANDWIAKLTGVTPTGPVAVDPRQIAAAGPPAGAYPNAAYAPNQAYPGTTNPPGYPQGYAQATAPAGNMPAGYGQPSPYSQAPAMGQSAGYAPQTGMPANYPVQNYQAQAAAPPQVPAGGAQYYQAQRPADPQPAGAPGTPAQDNVIRVR